LYQTKQLNIKIMSYLTNFEDKQAEAIDALLTLQLLAPLRDFDKHEDLIVELQNLNNK
jgi:hypothetical protein